MNGQSFDVEHRPASMSPAVGWHMRNSCAGTVPTTALNETAWRTGKTSFLPTMPTLPTCFRLKSRSACIRFANRNPVGNVGNVGTPTHLHITSRRVGESGPHSKNAPPSICMGVDVARSVKECTYQSSPPTGPCLARRPRAIWARPSTRWLRGLPARWGQPTAAAAANVARSGTRSVISTSGSRVGSNGSTTSDDDDDAARHTDQRPQRQPTSDCDALAAIADRTNGDAGRPASRSRRRRGDGRAHRITP